MLRVPGIEPFRETPLVAREAGPWTQDAQDFPERAGLVGRMRHGLDGESRVVELVVLGNPHVVGVDEAAQGLHVPCVQFRPLDLVGVVVDTDEARPGMPREIAHRPAHPASHIEHLHPRLQGQPFGEIVLVPEQRRLEALAPAPGSEVKGLAPAELVKVRHQVVIPVHERPIMLLSAVQAGVVDRGVTVDGGFHLVGGEVGEGAGTRSSGGGSGHRHILPESRGLP